MYDEDEGIERPRRPAPQPPPPQDRGGQVGQRRNRKPNRRPARRRWMQ